jgi:hypothetical protein
MEVKGSCSKSNDNFVCIRVKGMQLCVKKGISHPHNLAGKIMQ